LDIHKANALAPNWGTYIFQSANEVHANQMIRKRMEELQSQAKAEKEWWEKKRASVQAEFMKELETEKPQGNPKTGTTGNTTGKGSDDDTVMVEGGGPAEKGHSGGKKKKRGKH
jgi:translocation protein SEC66